MLWYNLWGLIVQLVEHRIRIAKVAGSIPAESIVRRFGPVAQMARAHRWQRWGQGFDPPQVHCIQNLILVWFWLDVLHSFVPQFVERPSSNMICFYVEYWNINFLFLSYGIQIRSSKLREEMAREVVL